MVKGRLARPQKEVHLGSLIQSPPEENIHLKTGQANDSKARGDRIILGGLPYILCGALYFEYSACFQVYTFFWWRL